MDTKSLWCGIEGIVFDAVGTLIEPDPPVANVYVTAARRQGVELDPIEVRNRFYRRFRDDEADEILGPMRTDEALEFRRWRRIVSQVLPELPDPERGFHELWAHFARPDAWRVFPDVSRAVRAAADAGLKVGIASNFDARLRGLVDGLPGLEALAGALVISSEVGYRKPHSGFYEAVCRVLELPPASILFVGDDLENDVNGPSRAGLHAVQLDRKGRTGEHGRERFATLTDLIATAPFGG